MEGIWLKCKLGKNRTGNVVVRRKCKYIVATLLANSEQENKAKSTSVDIQYSAIPYTLLPVQHVHTSKLGPQS